MKALFILCFSFCALISFSQNSKIDSLVNEINDLKIKTSYINTIMENYFQITNKKIKKLSFLELNENINSKEKFYSSSVSNSKNGNIKQNKHFLRLVSKFQDFLPNKCVFSPAIGVIYLENNLLFEYIFSFSCKSVRIYKNKEFIGIKSFSVVYSDILDLSYKMFPNNDYFKQLKDLENKNQ